MKSLHIMLLLKIFLHHKTKVDESEIRQEKNGCLNSTQGKLSEACKKYGVPMPEYTLHLEDIMVKFTPLGYQDILKDQNVLLNDPLNVLLDDSLEKVVLSAIKENSHITQAQLATKLDRSDRQIRRVIKELREKRAYRTYWKPQIRTMDCKIDMKKVYFVYGKSTSTVLVLSIHEIITPEN